MCKIMDSAGCFIHNFLPGWVKINVLNGTAQQVTDKESGCIRSVLGLFFLGAQHVCY